MDVTKLVTAYINIRDKRAEAKKAFEEEDRVLESRLETIENALLEVCKDTGVESLRTTAGTATRTVKERVDRKSTRLNSSHT